MAIERRKVSLERIGPVYWYERPFCSLDKVSICASGLDKYFKIPDGVDMVSLVMSAERTSEHEYEIAALDYNNIKIRCRRRWVREYIRDGTYRFMSMAVEDGLKWLSIEILPMEN